MRRIPLASIAAVLAMGACAPALAHDHGEYQVSRQGAQAGWQGGWVSPTSYNYTWMGYDAPQTVRVPDNRAQYDRPDYDRRDYDRRDSDERYQDDPRQAGAAYARTGYQDSHYQEMADRCQRLRPGGGGGGGALVGGAVGGLIGNRVASGDRLLGTVVGAGVGAIAGSAADRANHRARERECDEFFSRYAPPAPAPVQPAYAPGGVYAQGPAYPQTAAYPMPGYAPYGYMMVPVITQPQQPCVEKTVVTERWVEQPVRERVVYTRPKVVYRTVVLRDKRVPDKRVYTGY